MAGILYVVATPIGNLEDVTLRALRILRDVSLVAAEDTRRTARLLQHYSISTRTTSLHAHNERDKTAQLIRRLNDGESIALVSDAGTPVISDPGQLLVAAARSAGIRVEPVPGASAVMAALSASGVPMESFAFAGFPPIRSKDRIPWLREWYDRGLLTVFFEAPHRLKETLADVESVFGGDHQVGLARELTKTHEELVVKPISALRRELKEPRGEFTLIIFPHVPVAQAAPELPSADALRLEIGQLAKSGGLRGRAALKILAAKYGRSVNELYALVEERET